MSGQKLLVQLLMRQFIVSYSLSYGYAPNGTENPKRALKSFISNAHILSFKT